jgi:hypothetical protein
MKNFKFYLIVWILLLAIFNVAVFVSPAEMAGYNKFGGAFWGGYIGITLAFFGQLAASFFAFRSKNLQKFFYKIPMIRISWTGLILTLIFGVLAMVIPNLPNWVGIILCFAILAFYAISLVKANTAAELVDEIDDKIKVQTFFIKSLTVDAEMAMAKAKTEEEKALAKKVYEAVRYSDPMSHEGLADVETRIGLAFNAFAAAINTETADEVLNALQERNSKCKILK